MCALYHHNATAVAWFSHYCFIGLRHPVPHRRQQWRVNHTLHQEATSSALLKGARRFALCEMKINWYEVFKRWDCWPMFLSKVWYHTCECTCTCSHTQRDTHVHTLELKDLKNRSFFFCFYLDESKAKYCHNANFDLKNKTRNWGFSCLQEFLKWSEHGSEACGLNKSYSIFLGYY